VVKAMPKAKPRTIDLAQADAVQQILPCSPVLSSHTAAWKGIHLEYHCQPAHETLNINQLEIVPQIFGRDPLIYQIGLELKKELEFARDDSHLYAESMATALAVHLMKRYAVQTSAIKTYSGGLSSYKLKTAIAYINEHLHQNLSLAEIAAVVQMSPHYFSSLFKQSTGLAPYQYVTQCRIGMHQGYCCWVMLFTRCHRFAPKASIWLCEM
jgi:YesN/AraC family two-component response regulator